MHQVIENNNKLIDYHNNHYITHCKQMLKEHLQFSSSLLDVFRKVWADISECDREEAGDKWSCIYILCVTSYHVPRLSSFTTVCLRWAQQAFTSKMQSILRLSWPQIERICSSTFSPRVWVGGCRVFKPSLRYWFQLDAWNLSINLNCINFNQFYTTHDKLYTASVFLWRASMFLIQQCGGRPTLITGWERLMIFQLKRLLHFRLTLIQTYTRHPNHSCCFHYKQTAASEPISYFGYVLYCMLYNMINHS